MYINSVLENNMRVIILAPASTNFRLDFLNIFFNPNGYRDQLIMDN